MCVAPLLEQGYLILREGAVEGSVFSSFAQEEGILGVVRY
jgi:hypothetical protein